jgi:hypothetical protein
MMAVPMGAWRRYPIGSQEAGTLESWRGTIYVDDLKFFVAGGFRNAVELSLRLLAELVVLGFSVNFKPGKSQIVPTHDSRHIGYVWNTLAMRIRLPQSRVAKITRACAELRARVVATHGHPDALAVARLIGLLWSAHMVAHRAVALMCRGMIRTLAVVLGTDAIRVAARMGRHDQLRRLLKTVYRGTVTWTAVADNELAMWESIDTATLSANIAFHCLDEEFKQWCWNPTAGVVTDRVRVFAVDTSDTASGGGEFVVDGDVWRLTEEGIMVTMLTEEQVVASSTFRECKGCEDLDLTCIPADCTKAVILCDNQATVAIMNHGSSVPALNAMAVRVFFRALRDNRVLHFVWIRRDEEIIKVCDGGSRLCLTADVSTPAAIFWRANRLVAAHFGRGFQFDRFASATTVCPPDTLAKLPFNSQFRASGTSGRDAFAHSWVGWVNWVAPPFILVTAVLDLMQGQGAKGAVIVPIDSRRGAAWAARIRPGAVGHVAGFSYRPSEYGDSEYGGRYAVVVLDYSKPGGPESGAPAAEDLT